MKWVFGIGLVGLLGITLGAAPWWRERQLHTVRHTLDLALVTHQQAQQRLAEARQALHETQTRQQVYDEFVTAQAELKAQQEAVAKQIAEAQTNLESTRQQLSAATAQVRAEAQGGHFEELALADGRKLRHATVQNVTPKGIVFALSTGEVLVRWRSLPLDFLERFFPEEAPARAAQQRAAFAAMESTDEPPLGPDDIDAPSL